MSQKKILLCAVLTLGYGLSAAAGHRVIGHVEQRDLRQTEFDVAFTTAEPGNTMVFYGATPALELGIRFKDGSFTDHQINVTNLEAGTCYYVQVASVNSANDTAYSRKRLMCTASASSGRIRAFFTRSIDSSVSNGTYPVYLPNTLPDTLAAYIDRAEQSLDICIYNWSHLSPNRLFQAVNDAHSRGVAVRVIYDANTPNTGLDSLDPAIPRFGRPSSSGIMHHKFVLIDAQYPDPTHPWVWIGSMNFTKDQFGPDAGHLIAFQDAVLVHAFRLEFNEMWGSDTLQPDSTAARFGTAKADNTPHAFKVGSKRVELYFSPSDTAEKYLRQALYQAQKAIYFNTYIFTAQNLAEAIRDRIAEGCHAAGLMHDTLWSTNAYDMLKPEMGEQLRINQFAYLLHHKYGITDARHPAHDPVVLTGSMNWSVAAQTNNDETLLLIYDDTLANHFYQEWAARFQENGGKLVPAPSPPQPGTQPVLYPNPATHRVTLHNTSPVSVAIFNTAGQQVYATAPAAPQQWSVADWKAGLYFVRITTQQRTVVRRLIVAR